MTLKVSTPSQTPTTHCAASSSSKKDATAIYYSLYAAFLFFLLVGVCGFGLAENHLRAADSSAMEGMNLQVVSPAITMAATTRRSSSEDAIITPQLGWIVAKPILVEFGVLVLLQAVGLPVLSKLFMPLRKIRWVSKLHYHKTWKRLLTVYKNTGASKIVQRSKKLVHIFLDHDHDDHDEHPTSSM